MSIDRGGDNVFADLCFAVVDSHKLKAEAVSRMIATMRDRRLTQVQAARMVGLRQPDISRLVRGQFRDISAARIMRAHPPWPRRRYQSPTAS